MSSFLFACFVGFFLYQFLRLVSVRAISGQRIIAVSEFVRVSMPEGAFRVVRLTLLAVVVIVLMLMVVKAFHPNDRFVFGYLDLFTSPLAASFVFGVSLGWIAAAITTRLLQEPSDYVFSYKDGLQLGLLFFLLILGIGGEDFVRSFGKRINKLAFAGAEVTLSEADSKQTARPGRGPSSLQAALAGSHAGAYAAYNGSQGLSIAQDIASSIPHRDEDYVRLISAEAAKSERFSAIERQERMLGRAVAPIVSCLNAMYKDGSGTSELNAKVSELIKPIKQLNAVHGDEAPEYRASIELLGETANAVLVDAYHLAPSEGTQGSAAALSQTAPNPAAPTLGPRTLLDECQPLARLLCSPPLVPEANVTLATPSSGASEADACVERRAAARGGDVYLGQDALRFDDAIRKVTDVKGSSTASSGLHELLTGPYLTIEYASLAAQLGHYESGAFALEQLLAKPPFVTPVIHSGAVIGDAGHPQGTDKIITDWLEIRVRESLASIVEEWIAAKSGGPTTLVEHHVKNFEHLIGLFERNAYIQNLVMRSGRLSPRIVDSFAAGAEDYGSCGWDPGQQTLVYVYVGAILSYLDFALMADDYKVENSGLIAGRADFVDDLNLHCLNPEGRSLLRAESLLQWARSQANVVRIGQASKSTAWLTDRLGKAMDAARLGESTLYPDYEKDKQLRTNTDDALFAAQTSQPMHVWTQLGEVEEEIRSLQSDRD